MASEDPFFSVKAEVEKSLSHLEELYSTWQKLLGGGKSGADQLKWTADEIKSSIKTIEWDIQDLEDTIRIVEANPQKFRLDAVEVGRRKQFVEKAKTAIDKSLDNGGSKLVANASEPSRARQKSANDFDTSRGDEIIRNEAQQQTMIMQTQDQQLDQVYGTVVNLKNIAITMGTELEDQEMLLENLDTRVDTAGGKLKAAMARIQNVLKADSNDRYTTCCIIVLGIIVVILLIFLII